ncbi:M14 family metallopeptidase [Crenobacter sp. SG2305]|uniref:succinylglutamate desuccinylase/aspartoacylase family protein n=1 Tax=Crenobacter oryzisoli TaxID=3056844 RepID=UPI0025AB204C|nr:succinylglutamate desuccinylase/aspartoacylase family protein [Crenobacter sp. SG2305]MDN0081646.1 M14 family metallopeptidase [Crenobacter sp. SG2305]
MTSLHFGDSSRGQPRAYIQAGLHASEIPGMLVAHYLREQLLELENEGNLIGEVILLPVSNPIGLDQNLLSYQMGRFDFASGENFNRFFPNLAEIIAAEVADQLDADPNANVRHVRMALRRHIDNLTCLRPIESLRKILLGLACDADIVLDLHCDCESVLHLYTHSAVLDEVMPLSALLGAHATLYAEVQGNSPFDEVNIEFWTILQALLPDCPLPLPTVTATIELRGQLDVSHDQAREDALAIIRYLQHRGFCRRPEAARVPLPSHQATPLAGTEVVIADRPGVITYLAECGQQLQIGDPVADIVDPINGEVRRHHATVSGVLFARQNRRYALPCLDLAYIAGSVSFRMGNLLSA